MSRNFIFFIDSWKLTPLKYCVSLAIFPGNCDWNENSHQTFTKSKTKCVFKLMKINNQNASLRFAVTRNSCPTTVSLTFENEFLCCLYFACLRRYCTTVPLLVLLCLTNLREVFCLSICVNMKTYLPTLTDNLPVSRFLLNSRGLPDIFF